MPPYLLMISLDNTILKNIFRVDHTDTMTTSLHLHASHLGPVKAVYIKTKNAAQCILVCVSTW